MIGTDKVFGACRRPGMEFTLPYCKEMRFSAALTLVTPSHIKDKCARTEYWQEELKVLDRLAVSIAEALSYAQYSCRACARAHPRGWQGTW